MLFIFAKTPRYYFRREHLGDEEDLWYIPDRPQSSNGLHAAAFPDRLVEKCLKVGCPDNGHVLDPFAGSGTTLRVALNSGRRTTGIDISPEFCTYMVERLSAL